jgi:hypothetical protein
MIFALSGVTGFVISLAHSSSAYLSFSSFNSASILAFFNFCSSNWALSCLSFSSVALFFSNSCFFFNSSAYFLAFSSSAFFFSASEGPSCFDLVPWTISTNCWYLESSTSFSSFLRFSRAYLSSLSWVSLCYSFCIRASYWSGVMEYLSVSCIS